MDHPVIDLTRDDEDILWEGDDKHLLDAIQVHECIYQDIIRPVLQAEVMDKIAAGSQATKDKPTLDIRNFMAVKAGRKKNKYPPKIVKTGRNWKNTL